MTDISKLDVSELEGKYLTFILMDELYGVSVDWIMQIIAVPNIIKIPKTPPYIKGVINQRGKIIPVMDLRARFSLPVIDYNERTSIIIIKMQLDNAEVFIGIIVDKVLEVLDIHAEEIENTPSLGANLALQNILGMAKVRNKVYSLLNIQEIVTRIDLIQMQAETGTETFTCPLAASVVETNI